MDASDLRIFESVARLGGIGRAAQELNTVQSNVTTRVRLLEQELGTPLFERHARGVRLTPAGRRLLPYAIEIRDLLSRARRAAADDGTPRGELTIGTLETTLAIRLTRIITSYAAAYREVELTLRTGTTRESVSRVLDRELDGAFVAGPIDHAELVQEAVFQEELVLATAPSVRDPFQLGRTAAVKLLVLRIGCSYRQRLETILATRGIVDVRALEFGSFDAIIGCVGAGIGITLLPRGMMAAPAGRGDVLLHPLPAAEAMVETLFIRRRDAYETSAITAFLQMARANAAQPAIALAAE